MAETQGTPAKKTPKKPSIPVQTHVFVRWSDPEGEIYTDVISAQSKTEITDTLNNEFPGAEVTHVVRGRLLPHQTHQRVQF